MYFHIPRDRSHVIWDYEMGALYVTSYLVGLAILKWTDMAIGKRVLVCGKSALNQLRGERMKNIIWIQYVYWGKQKSLMLNQGWFYACTQQMRDVVTK